MQATSAAFCSPTGTCVKAKIIKAKTELGEWLFNQKFLSQFFLGINQFILNILF